MFIGYTVVLFGIFSPAPWIFVIGATGLHFVMDSSVKPIAPTMSKLEARLNVIEARLERSLNMKMLKLMRDEDIRAAFSEIALLFGDIENKKIEVGALRNYLINDSDINEDFRLTNVILTIAYLMYTDDRAKISELAQRYKLAAYIEQHDFSPLVEALKNALRKEEKTVAPTMVTNTSTTATNTVTLRQLLTELTQK